VPKTIRYSMVLTVLFPSFAASQAYGYRFLRTDVEPANVIYDRVHQQFFASVPAKNEIEVISCNDGSLLARIDVPSPNGLDLSPDGSLLFVSGSGELPVIDGFFAIDAATFRVLRFVQSEPPFADPAGFQRLLFRGFAAMGNGKLFYNAVVSYDPYAPIFEYDPRTGASIPAAGSLFWGYMNKSANGARFVVTGSDRLQVYDAATDRFTAPVPLPKDRIPSGVIPSIFNSDGTRVLVNGHVVTDQYLNQIVDLWPDMDYRNCYGSAFSTDSSRVYCFGIPDLGSSNAIVRVFDATTGAILGDVPAPSPKSFWPSGIAVSPKGLALLTCDHGLALLDVSAPAQSLGRSPLVIDRMTPQAGAAESPTPVVFELVPGPSFAGSAFFFGALPGKVLQTGQSAIGETMVTVQPPSPPTTGAVDVSMRTRDGSAFYAPEGYSYGPVILFQDITAGPAAGGTKVHLFGYGFGSTPKVMIGGAGATITDLLPAPKIAPYSFPIQQLEFTTPPGPLGPADLTLTTPEGAVTQKNGYLYVSHSQVPGLQPLQMALDERRGSLYVADAVSGDVKAVDTNTLAVTTLIKMPSGAATGLALTPDGGKLLVISEQARTLTIYDLNARAVLKTFVPTPDGQTSVVWCNFCVSSTVTPLAVAGTARGTALVGLALDNVLDAGKLYEIDLKTGAAVDLSPYPGAGVGSVTWQMLLAPSADGSEIYIANSGFYETTQGYLSLWSSALGAVRWRRPISLAGVIDLSASASGDTVMCRSFTYSRRLDQLTVLAPNALRRSVQVFGQKINATGSLWYMPTTTGVEIYDVHRGDMRLSIGIPGGVQPVVDGMVINRTGTTIYVAESGALGVIQLPAAPLSISGVQFIGVGPGTRGRGTEKLTVQGSGFQEGAMVRIGQTIARTNVLSSSEMTITAPVLLRPRHHADAAVPFGIVEELSVSVTNPNGDTYQLPASYDPNLYPTEPQPVLSAVSASPPHATFSLAISGSGFLVTSEVYVDGESVHTAYVDSQHLAVYLYGLPSGKHSVTVVNPHSGASNTLAVSL
jgi:DNA-binding beta-propeller fold protein YncE